MKKLIAIFSIILLTSVSKPAKVFVCTGNTMATYHSDRNCSALTRCKQDVKELPQDEAIKQGRHSCNLCYKVMFAVNKPDQGQ